MAETSTFVGAASALVAAGRLATVPSARRREIAAALIA
jgi:hypothetical protein